MEEIIYRLAEGFCVLSAYFLIVYLFSSLTGYRIAKKGNRGANSSASARTR